MSILKLNKTLADGLVADYHAVAEVIFDTKPNLMLVKIASYVDKAKAFAHIQPDSITVVPIEYTGTYMEAVTDLLNKLMLQPGWTGGELIES